MLILFIVVSGSLVFGCESGIDLLGGAGGVHPPSPGQRGAGWCYFS
jgi:hypothetical protein